MTKKYVADYTCDIRMTAAAADLQTACGDRCGSGCMQMQQSAVCSPQFAGSVNKGR